MNPLQDLAVGLSRHEADRLRFSHRPIVAVPHDPVAHAVCAIDTARADFEFAIAEKWNAGDVEGMAQLVEHIQACADGLLMVETMARDFAGRMPK